MPNNSFAKHAKRRNPKVSIILCTYNRSHVMGKAIDSILKQSFKDYELIIINDGSTDNTNKVIAQYDDARIIHIKKRHTGLPSSRNEALRRAKGKYIAYCDDDCVYYPNHIQRLSDHLDANPKIGLVYSDGIEVVLGYEFLKNCDFDKRRLEAINFFMVLNVMHRKQIINAAGTFNERLLVADDWDMWLRISDISPIAHLPAITGRHIHNQGVSTLGGSKKKVSYLSAIIKKRWRKALTEGKTEEYIDGSSLSVLKTLIAYGNTGFAMRLAKIFYKTRKSYQTLACLGLCFLAQRDFAQALFLLKKALKRLSRDHAKHDAWQMENVLTVRNYLSLTFYHLNKPSLAMRNCLRTLKKQSNNAEARITLAMCYLKAGYSNKALVILDPNKIEACFFNPAIFNLRGCCFFNQRKYDLAINEFNKAVLIYPSLPLYHYNLAKAYARANEHLNAKSEYQKALNLKRTFKDAKS